MMGEDRNEALVPAVVSHRSALKPRQHSVVPHLCGTCGALSTTRLDLSARQAIHE